MTAAAARERGRFRSETLVVSVFALVGLWRGLWPIADNSAFTHLATGIRMVSTGVLPSIPRVDPYTFTARGHEWLVQSWLPSAVVGWSHRIGGEHAVVLLSGVTMGALAWLIGSLARTGRALRTAVAAGAALLVSAPTWAQRPLLVGLLCLGLTVLIVERRWAPWWLVPLVWVWVNSHGSFPLGLLWVALVTAGAAIDARDRISARYLVAFAAGLVAALANPLGWRLLAFPFTALAKREVFAEVVEWGSPDFQNGAGSVMLVGLVIAAAVLVRGGRLTWRDALPVAVFLGLGLTAQRNLAPLGVVLAPALGRALAADEPTRIADETFRVVAAGLAVAALFVGVLSTRDNAIDTSAYPVRSVEWLEKNERFDRPHRVAATDRVGNYLALRRGARGEVFFDDRVDMFPISVARDYLAMHHGTDRGVRALDRRAIDTVLWESDEPFPQRLQATGEWSPATREEGWVVLVRRK